MVKDAIAHSLAFCHQLQLRRPSQGSLNQHDTLQKLLSKSATNREVVEELYLAALSRCPTEKEHIELEKLFGQQESEMIRNVKPILRRLPLLPVQRAPFT